jgi:hypothetical protein
MLPSASLLSEARNQVCTELETKNNKFVSLLICRMLIK